MKRKEVLEHLIDIARQVFDRVVYVRADFRSGFCRVHGENCMFLNRNAGIDNNLRILGKALANTDTSHLLMKPVIREFIEQFEEEPISS
ncbi:hypothetical protein K8I28_08305 [bacterium]|nr:hypothetical protein [bacterium]